MAWAIVAVVLVAVAGVGWYVLRSTPSTADLQGAAPPAPGSDGKPVDRSQATQVSATPQELADCARQNYTNPAQVLSCVNDKIQARLRASMGTH